MLFAGDDFLLLYFEISHVTSDRSPQKNDQQLLPHDQIATSITKQGSQP